jgi:uncharacterized protein (DUF305 family)
MKVKTRALRTFGLFAAVTAFLLLAGCSGGGSDEGSAPDDAASSSDLTIIQPGKPGEEASTGTPEEPIEEPPSQADIAFMQMMVPHHAQAVEMAELARKYAVDPGVRRMADRIRAAQGPEILMMSSWLERQGIDVPGPGHDHGSMPGMLTEAQLTELADARGARFDRLFLRGMIRHHKGALQMAEDVSAEGVDVIVSEVAADVYVTQTAEISTMQEMLANF